MFRRKYFPFDAKKAVQAMAILYSLERAKSVPYYRLLKLLYIANREHFREKRTPIVGGRPVAMNAGPLSSPVYDLIKGVHHDSRAWNQHFDKHTRYVELLDHPGNDELSKREIRKLQEVSARYSLMSDSEIGDLTHDFPEYKKNFEKDTSRSIPLTDLINAVGLSEAKETILESLDFKLKMRSFLEKDK